DVEKFYNIFVWDRYYIGGAVVRPSTFNDWIRDGGDDAFAGEIYYNNVMIRGAKPENRQKAAAAKMRSATMAKAAEGRNVADYWKRLAAKLAEADRSASDDEAKPATAKN
ncbi:MAG: hypothetical protein OET79_11370, partial [Nitrospirota bacterium]|nr:hypothetical protein [Nitrospirota bacterium]